MDKLQWFKFSPSDWMMGKIQKCTAETRGMFMNLCCLYWNKNCELTLEDAEIEVDEHLQILIKKKIIKVDGQNVQISFLDEQYEEILEMSDKRRDAAKKRWSNKNASAYNGNASALQNDADKSKIIEELDKEKIKKEVILLCSISDETELANDHQKIAWSFWKLFESNLIESGMSNTATLNKAKLEAWEKDVRLMMEKDKRTREELLTVFQFLKKDEFWKSNIQSVSKLRQQFEKIYLKAKNNAAPKNSSQSNFDAIRDWANS